MKIEGRSQSRRLSVALTRVLAFTLLVPIAYAMTFGIAHTHADYPSAPAISQIASDSSPSVESIGRPINARSHGFGCLLCSLRQQIFNSSFAAAFFVVP